MTFTLLSQKNQFTLSSSSLGGRFNKKKEDHVGVSQLLVHIVIFCGRDVLPKVNVITESLRDGAVSKSL